MVSNVSLWNKSCKSTTRPCFDRCSRIRTSSFSTLFWVIFARNKCNRAWFIVNLSEFSLVPPWFCVQIENPITEDIKHLRGLRPFWKINREVTVLNVVHTWMKMLINFMEISMKFWISEVVNTRLISDYWLANISPIFPSIFLRSSYLFAWSTRSKYKNDLTLHKKGIPTWVKRNPFI